MVDKKRSRMMASVRTSGTKPELLVRKVLLAEGYRYRLGENYRRLGRKLPGKPDIVLPGRKAVIFVHGCFWHRHDCHLFVGQTRVGLGTQTQCEPCGIDQRRADRARLAGRRSGVPEGQGADFSGQLTLRLTRWIEEAKPRCIEISASDRIQRS